MHKTITGTAVALSATALTIGTAGVASAELYGIDDPVDTWHGSDVLSLSVRNGDENVVVKTIHDNLVKAPRSGSAGTVFIDTDQTDRGPEYAFVAGYTRGADFVLIHTEGFRHRQWGDPVENGDYMMRVRYKRDTVTLKISHAALGDANDVRVAVRVTGTRTDGTSHGLVDWVGKRRSFTPWIAQG